ncbi:hypothetical protein VTO42DRAFT_1812 [Malbranchea cinnamomea]
MKFAPVITALVLGLLHSVATAAPTDLTTARDQSSSTCGGLRAGCKKDSDCCGDLICAPAIPRACWAREW